MKTTTFDPLETLGSSLFVFTLSHLSPADILSCETTCKSWRQAIHAHENGIWRAACHRVIPEPAVLERLLSRECGETSSGQLVCAARPDEERGTGSVDWREECKAAVMLDRNWCWGRCRERRVAPISRSVWRIKVDHEQGTIISTSRMGLSTSRMAGLMVTDLATSQPLFIIPQVHPWAHLEFAKGFVIFDADQRDSVTFTFTLPAMATGSAEDAGGFYVYRTSDAVARSAHDEPPRRQPRGAFPGLSMSGGDDMRTSTGPLPRGHLAFYRQIVPPSECRAFRARVDRADTPHERAVLGTASEQGVYIWDLDDPERVERIDIPYPQRQEIRYIEFDDDYVFLCSLESVRVYSRETAELVLAFPERGERMLEVAKVGYDLPFDTAPRWQDMIVKRPVPKDGYRSTPVAAVDVPLVSAENTLRKLILVRRVHGQGEWNRIDHSRTMPGFNACHYTPTDLICTSSGGVILIIRDYRTILAIPEADERKAQLRENTIWLGLGHHIKHLSTYGTRVSVVTAHGLFWFDTSTLPSLPLSDPNPSIRVYRVCSTLPKSVGHSGCLQMDRENIQMSYFASSEETVRGVVDPETGEVFTANAAGPDGLNCFVRIWNFTA